MCISGSVAMSSQASTECLRMTSTPSVQELWGRARNDRRSRHDQTRPGMAGSVSVSVKVRLPSPVRDLVTPTGVAQLPANGCGPRPAVLAAARLVCWQLGPRVSRVGDGRDVGEAVGVSHL